MVDWGGGNKKGADRAAGRRVLVFACGLTESGARKHPFGWLLQSQAKLFVFRFIVNEYLGVAHERTIGTTQWTFELY